MWDLTRVCPVCNMEMPYRPMQIWTGMRYRTTMHRWECTKTDEDGTQHGVSFTVRPSDEYLEWEKNK